MTSISQGKPQSPPLGDPTSLAPPLDSSNPQATSPANPTTGVPPPAAATQEVGTGVQVGRGEWKLKDIGLWPDERVGGMFRRQVKVLLQNANGPCSLLALANCLLLRGSIHIHPKHSSISYDDLALLIGDFLITRPNPNSTLELSAALNILPTMTRGLDVDICFDGIRSFKGVTTAAAELAVFEYAGVDLIHGWLWDQGRKEEYEALKRVDERPTFDAVQDAIVAGLEAQTRTAGLEDKGETISPEDRRAIDDSEVLQHFLQTTQNGLTYPGLWELSSLEPGSVVAFFRSSHLSVLYRRYDPSTSTSSSEPVLFSLVTDSAFAKEPEVTWESIVDIDSSGSNFYNGEFRRSDTAGGDYAGMSAAQAARMADRLQAQEEGRLDDTADAQLAAALQQEENRREIQSRPIGAAGSSSRTPPTGSGSGRTPPSGGQQGDPPQQTRSRFQSGPSSRSTNSLITDGGPGITRDNKHSPSKDEQEQDEDQDSNRANGTTPNWRRLAYIVGLLTLVWAAYGQLTKPVKPRVIYASRYSDEFKHRPAASPVITQILKDGTTLLRGANIAGVGVSMTDLPKTPRQIAKEKKEREKEALDEAKRQLGMKKRPSKDAKKRAKQPKGQERPRKGKTPL